MWFRVWDLGFWGLGLRVEAKILWKILVSILNVHFHKNIENDEFSIKHILYGKIIIRIHTKSLKITVFNKNIFFSIYYGNIGVDKNHGKY